jgi:predicted metal-dependent enzyme (double-stranded beta helix superfamily)
MTSAIESVQPGLAHLVAGLRGAVHARHDGAQTVRLVTAELRQHVLEPSLLTAEQRIGDPACYRTHTLHVESDGSFSVTALVWLPGQATRIHDHVSWCVFGVVQGIEHEELFDTNLSCVGVNDNHPGEVSGFTPPGDIHRVRNISDVTAISIHVYGADISRVGSSVRRYYDAPPDPG